LYGYSQEKRVFQAAKRGYSISSSDRKNGFQCFAD